MYDEAKDRRRPVLEAATRGNAAEWVEEHLSFKPDEKQRFLLATESKRVVVNCSRQWGKTLIGSAKAVHLAWTKPESVTLIVSPSIRQSHMFVSKVKRHVSMLGIKPRSDGVNEVSVLFPNGSVIIGLPANEATIRGFTASLLLVDEAAKVSNKLYEAIKPALSTTDGPEWLMSTPYGQRGFFYKAWAQDEDDCVRVSAPATECPRISAKFLERERRNTSERMFRQEYLCEFTAPEDGAFDPELIDKALDNGLEPLDLY